MSILEDFALGFLQGVKNDVDQKAADTRATQERKRLYAERLAEENRRRKLDRLDREEERKTQQAGRVVDKYTRDDGKIVEVLGDGTERVIRSVTEAERRAGEQAGVLDLLEQQKTQSAIDLNRARAANATAAANRPSRSEREPNIAPAKPEVALAALGLTTEPAQGSPEFVVYLEQLAGKVSPDEAQDRLQVLRRNRVTQQAKQDAITNRLGGF